MFRRVDRRVVARLCRAVTCLRLIEIRLLDPDGRTVLDGPGRLKDPLLWSAETPHLYTAVGDFQSELGCPGDWQPDCLKSWLQDPDGDGIFTFTTTAIPPGAYEGKVAINESWDENYGANATRDGAGDIAVCGSAGAIATGKLLDGQPGTVFIAGDIAYPDGTAEQFHTCFEPAWGRHKSRTRPSRLSPGTRRS